MRLIKNFIESGIRSQSPQMGQFNSYNGKGLVFVEQVIDSLNPLKRVNSILTRSLPYGGGRSLCFYVSIPSNRSIQFLRGIIMPSCWKEVDESQSPQTGQFNSDKEILAGLYLLGIWSQSPQTGQFNSYFRRDQYSARMGESPVSIPSNGSFQFLQTSWTFRKNHSPKFHL